MGRPKIAVVGLSYLRELGISRLQGGYEVACISEPASSLFCFSDVCVPISSIDATDSELLDALRSAERRLGGLDGVICLRDPNLVATARAAKRMKLRFPCDSSLGEVLDKYAFRLLANRISGCVSATVRLIESRSDWSTFFACVDAALQQGPLIMKPRRGSCSYHIVQIASKEDIPRAWEVFSRATNYRGGDFIVEDLVEGTESSVECVIQSGLRLALQTTYLPRVKEFEFTESGHAVDFSSWMPRPIISRSIEQLCQLSGLDDCILHVEFLETPTGPFLIEVNPRLAGDWIPELHRHVHGRDLYMLACKIAVGDDIAQECAIRNTAYAALVRFSAPGIKTSYSDLVGTELSGKHDRVTFLQADCSNGLNNDARGVACMLVGQSPTELEDRAERIISAATGSPKPHATHTARPNEDMHSLWSK